LKIIVKDKGNVWIREKWEIDGVKWKDFINEDEVDEFVKENMME
jgi:hypothetical protein